MNEKIGIYLLFVGFMLIGSFSGIFLYYNSAIEVLEIETARSLSAIAQSRAHHVNDFLENEKENLEVLARDHHFSDLLLGLTEEDIFYRELNITHYTEVLEYFKRDGYYELLLLDREGIIVGSSD